MAATVENIPERARARRVTCPACWRFEEIGDRLFRVTDGDYQAMVAGTGEGLVAFNVLPAGSCGVTSAIP